MQAPLARTTCGTFSKRFRQTATCRQWMSSFQRAQCCSTRTPSCCGCCSYPCAIDHIHVADDQRVLETQFGIRTTHEPHSRLCLAVLCCAVLCCAVWLCRCSTLRTMEPQRLSRTRSLHTRSVPIQSRTQQLHRRNQCQWRTLAICF